MQHKLYAELETVKPGTTVSHYLTARACGQAPIEGYVVENDIKGRKMKISDGEMYVFSLGRDLH